MAKRRKVNPKGSFLGICDKECNHDWHFIRCYQNFMLDQFIAVFICQKCGLMKKVVGEEEY